MLWFHCPVCEYDQVWTIASPADALNMYYILPPQQIRSNGIIQHAKDEIAEHVPWLKGSNTFYSTHTKVGRWDRLQNDDRAQLFPRAGA